MNQDKEIYVLDTSALLTYIEDEDGSEDVEDFLVKAEKGVVEIYIAALCREYEGTIVHKDPEFEKFSPPLKEFRLPYKPLSQPLEEAEKIPITEE